MGDEIPAAADSPLAGLRAGVEKARANLYLDLRVPRIEPKVFVRFGPLEKAMLDKVNKQIFESKADDAEVVGKSVALSHACLGVFTVNDSGAPVGDPSSWPKFDQELGEILGLSKDSGAVGVVRKLYLTDGDILAAVSELADWSAQSEQRIVEEYEGN